MIYLKKTMLIDWKYNEGILSQLNKSITQTITFVVTAALDFLHKNVYKRMV
jgi:hypothetical protein